MPVFAFDADITAHQVGEAFGDGKAEAGTAEFSGGGGIGLLKGLKQPVLLLRCEPDAGVDHLEFQHDLIAGFFQQPDRDQNLSALGELDGVVRIIDQDLRQA